jgi:Fe-S cluster biogenesis protein NfuA
MTRVQFEPTPNPATMKFILPTKVTEQTHDFATAQEAEVSPLAAKIFGFPWTSRVFLGPDFLTITKQDWVDWDVLSEPLAGLIGEHLERGEPIIHEINPEAMKNDEDPNDSTVVKEIKRALNREIRPVVALDGGDVVFAKYDDHVLYLQMKGACAGCPSSSATLKEGIEVRMRELFPEIREVVGI